ncbi:Na/Pi cotransporter family protein [Ruminococcus sp. AF21-42]|jgi:phosphate:Na+ symporter|uniref:Na/Pi cotransporter family protein n=1 Tax=Blautia TaxID=572511 RepID=UPI000E555E3B|nr:Na/Pi cotransporter family protein [Blautia luti]RHQ93893.1 Na/Pi cotransporter family protein [Ruminococcus sp. AF21-42]
MNENVKVVFGLIGGLALFLFGMNSMSDALQKAAGEKMKKILGFLTRNPIMGALAGALVTAVLQSSSATTVMVIGFVSAGLMSLPQAISVIFGANIGTTMTAQLMAFKISNYIYPIIFIGFMLNFVGKKEKVKNIGMVIFSFGLLFEGIEIMGEVMKPLAGSPVFVDLMGKVSSVPVLGVVLGAVMTLVVQSSSATIAVLQNFASQAGPDGVSSVIGLTGAIPILLGDNIGTTITALLASIGQSKNAKRTAIAHSIFNISGSCVFIFLIPWFAKFVQFISPKGNEVDVISRQIANAHTTFNIVCTLVWLPLIPLMVKIVTTIIRGDDKVQKTAFEPKYLDMKVVEQPAAAMVLVSKELNRLSELAESLLTGLKVSLTADKTSETYLHFKENLEIVQHLQESVSDYITRLFSSGNLTEQQSEYTAGLLFINNCIQRIAERCVDVDKICMEISDSGKVLTKEASAEMENCIDVTSQLLDKAMEAVRHGDSSAAESVFKNKKKMQKAEKKFNKAHLNRVKNNLCDASMTGYFSGIIYNIDRMADNCVGIAEEACDNVTFISLDEEANKTVAEGGAV